MYDIVVVGGNLAGTSAAITASEKGASVALIEKNMEPCNPAHCGEGVDTVTAAFIDFEKINCYTNPIDHMVIGLTQKKEYLIHFKKQALLVFDRTYLEKSLLQTCKQQGVDVFVGTKMINYKPPHTIITDVREDIKGKVIIDASGIACVVGRKMGMKPTIRPEDIGVCMQSRVQAEVKKDTIKTWFHKPYAPFGYGWVFPIDDMHVNIGIGIPGGQHVDMKSLLESYISHEYGDHYRILDTFRACVPSASPVSRMVQGNVLLTGDAARLANAFLGSGIANAITSGCLAGGISAEYVQGSISSLQLYREVLTPKMNRLQKVYDKRSRVLFKDSFYPTYKRGFFVLSLMNKLMPTMFNKQVENILAKDVSLIQKFKSSPTLF